MAMTIIYIYISFYFSRSCRGVPTQGNSAMPRWYGAGGGVDLQAGDSNHPNPSRKIDLISSDPVGPVLDIKLIRTDTTLDLSQGAERRVWFVLYNSSFLCVQKKTLLLWVLENVEKAKKS